VASSVGFCEGFSLGEAVGSAVDGESLGESVGCDVDGESLGEVEGSAVVGLTEGPSLGLFEGDKLGTCVG